MLLLLLGAMSGPVTIKDTTIALPGNPTPPEYNTIVVFLTSDGRLRWRHGGSGATYEDVPGQWYVGPQVSGVALPHDVSFYSLPYAQLSPGSGHTAEVYFGTGDTSTSIDIRIREGNGDPSGRVFHAVLTFTRTL